VLAGGIGASVLLLVGIADGVLIGFSVVVERIFTGFSTSTTVGDTLVWGEQEAINTATTRKMYKKRNAIFMTTPFIN